MSVRWIKDVDSGELFPIVDEEEEFNIPEHLRASEHTAIDYEKTTKNIIADLQEQLTAAQEMIDVYKNVQAVELPKEFYEEAQQHRILIDNEKTNTTTSADLHEQLSAVQNQIDVYKNAHVADFQKLTKKQCTLTDKPKRFVIGKSWILYIVLCIVSISAIILFFRISYDNGYRFFENSSGNYVFTQEAVTADEEAEETESEESEEGFNQFQSLIVVGLTILGVRFATRFVLHVVRDC